MIRRDHALLRIREEFVVPEPSLLLVPLLVVPTGVVPGQLKQLISLFRVAQLPARLAG